MDSGSDDESNFEGDVNSLAVSGATAAADWGKAKYDYYYTDYVDKDYPNKLTAKEEKLASIEQEEALRAQKKLLSTLDGVDLDLAYEDNENQDSLLEYLEKQNACVQVSLKRKRVTFDEKSDDNDDEDDDDEDDDSEDDEDEEQEEQEQQRKRRPINVAIQKNRGLTPYKKKEYRNPRVKHKLKYKKAMSKRRRSVKEVKSEVHRYSGESAGIKTSTIKSIKLC